MENLYKIFLIHNIYKLISIINLGGKAAIIKYKIRLVLFIEKLNNKLLNYTQRSGKYSKRYPTKNYLYLITDYIF